MSPHIPQRPQLDASRMSASDQSVAETSVGIVPERSFIESQICRAEARMNRAKSSKWAHLWCGVMIRKINARNAMRSVAELRQIELARGLLA